MVEAGSLIKLLDALQSSRLVPTVFLVCSMFVVGCKGGGTNGGANGIDLAISMTHSGGFDALSGTATFAITVTNVGEAATSAITTVTDSLPPGLTSGGGTSGNWTCSATNNNRNITCTNMSSIVVGATSNIALFVTVKDAPPGPVSNTAVVSTLGAAGNSATDTVFLNSCTGSTSGNEAALRGQYAVLAQGFDAAGSPIALVLSFTADGLGHITGGEEDLNNSAAPQHLTINSASSLYTVGPNDLACLQLAYSGGMRSSAMFRFALGDVSNGIASKGWAIGFDDNHVSGMLRLQDPTAFAIGQLQPNYALGADGVDLAGRHVAIAGFINLATGGIQYDLDEGGPLGTQCSGTGHVTSLSGTNGRGVLTLTPGCGFLDSAHEAIYVVNAHELFFVQIDPFAGGLQFGGGSSIVSGRAVATGSSFNSSSLSGNYILHMTGQSGGASHDSLALLTFTPGSVNTGTVSGTQFGYSASGGATTTAVTSASYTVDPASGRVTFSGTGVGTMVAYLATPTDGVSAFLVAEPDDALGVLEFQPNQIYTTAGAVGSYLIGTEDPGDNTVGESAGDVLVETNGFIDEVSDITGPGGQGALAAHAPIGQLNINSDGTGTNGSPGGIPVITNGQKVFLLRLNGPPAVITVLEK